MQPHSVHSKVELQPFKLRKLFFLAKCVLPWRMKNNKLLHTWSTSGLAPSAQQFPRPMKQFGANCGNKESSTLLLSSWLCGARRKRPESRREVPGKRRRRPATPARISLSLPLPPATLHTCLIASTHAAPS